MNLVELEGLIEHQRNHECSSPNLVTKELIEVLNGLRVGFAVGRETRTLSSAQLAVLEDLSVKLKHYPIDEQYRFVELTPEDHARFAELQTMLREAGFGMNIALGGGMNGFITRAERLTASIEQSLSA